MDQDLFNWVLGVGMTLLGWIGKTLWDAVAALKEDITRVEVDLPTSYVRKDELQTKLERLETMLVRIYDKLETKVDK